jgi:hypothetical protein
MDRQLQRPQLIQAVMVPSRIVTLYPVAATAPLREQLSFTIHSFHTRKFLLNDDWQPKEKQRKPEVSQLFRREKLNTISSA